ncbi:MAG: glucose-6-phosphate isomerase, partial [Pseudomonadota bacterium]
MTDIWNQLANYHQTYQTRRIETLFQQQKNRFQDFSLSHDGLIFDYSKTNIDEKCRTLLLALCEDSKLTEKRNQMFNGAIVNESEQKPALHSALRSTAKSLFVNGHNIMPDIIASREKMKHFFHSIYLQKKIKYIVNIGIGGSYLGPLMAYNALNHYCQGPIVKFVSNSDGSHVNDILRPLDRQSTLIIVSSKSFTTKETLLNAQAAINWLSNDHKQSIPHDQLIAITSNSTKAIELNFSPEQIFAFEHWIGGRTSIWGPIGLPLMLAIGDKNFEAFLKGAYHMDMHFKDAPLKHNLPILAALTDIWHHTVCAYPTRAILPYEQSLLHLPTYLQQLEMESNGKSIKADGQKLDKFSSPIIWGGTGSNTQHSFFQLLHQGSHTIPCEFLISRYKHNHDLKSHHDLLKANCIAQSKILMTGCDFEQAYDMLKDDVCAERLKKIAKQCVLEGNKPSMTIIYPKLTPYRLGQLLAFYEHRVFVVASILKINPF